MTMTKNTLIYGDCAGVDEVSAMFEGGSVGGEVKDVTASTFSFIALGPVVDVDEGAVHFLVDTQSVSQSSSFSTSGLTSW